MTTVVYAIVDSLRFPNNQPHVLVPATHVSELHFIPGLSFGERTFIRANRYKLGSGAAKQAADYTHAKWVAFRSTPLVLQLLSWVATIIIVINTPYLLMYTWRASQARDGTRMVTSLGAIVTLITMIAAVHMLL